MLSCLSLRSTDSSLIWRPALDWRLEPVSSGAGAAGGLQCQLDLNRQDVVRAGFEIGVSTVLRAAKRHLLRRICI